MSTDYFLPHIAHMKEYVPGEQPHESGYIKLNTNENPYPPSPLVLQRLRAACREELKLYPDPDAGAVRRKLSKIFAVHPEETMVGNGSDELLNIIIRSFAGSGQKVAYPRPTYGYYEKLIHLQNARQVPIDFPEDFSLPPDLAVEDARIILIANPNSPSGTQVPCREIAALASATKGVLVVDEAYVDFAEDGCIRLIDAHPNIIVVRTMSKSFSLAGMRIGFGFANRQLVAGLGKVKEHYNMGRLSLVAAEAALEDMATMRVHAARICSTREHLVQGLRDLGFSVWNSAANFVLARIEYPPARRVYAELRKRRILVRYFDQNRLRDCLRITVGKDEEIAALLQALEEILQKDHCKAHRTSAVDSQAGER